MRRLAIGMAFGMFVVSSLPLAAEVKTLKGEVVDQACFLKDKANRGTDHADCTESCLKKGKPAALVTEDGTVYTFTGKFADEKNAKLVAFASKTVEVKGEVGEADGHKTIDAASVMAAK
jgi:hypothetical protein